MAMNIQTEITLVIKTDSLQRAMQICKLARFEGHVEIDTSNKSRKGEMKQAIFELLRGKFGYNEFSFSMAASLVKAQLKRGGSTTRHVLLFGVDEGAVRRVENGIYAFIDAKHETDPSGPKGSRVEEVAPNAL